MFKCGLKKEYYDKIKNGDKVIELRLNDQKRQLMKIGDIIRFGLEPDREEFIEAKIVGLLKYRDFASLLEDIPVNLLGFAGMSKEEALTLLNEFYSSRDEKRYGVVGIRIELIQKVIQEVYYDKY